MIEKLKLVAVSGMGDNPASVDLDTGVVEVNIDIWPYLNEVQRELILLHELGHIQYDTVDNEELADRYVLERFAGSQDYSLRTAVEELLDILDNPAVAADRKKNLIKNALKIDSALFGSDNAQKLLDEIEQEEERKASCVIATAVASIVAAAIALTGLLTQTIFGKRNQWSRGKKNEENAYRVELLQLSTSAVCADILAKYTHLGELAVRAQIRHEKFPDKVHAHMVRSGVFTDNSMFTKNWRNPNDFFAAKNYGWSKKYILEQSELEILKIREIFAAQGFPDPDKKGGNTKKIVLIAAGVVAVILLIKILKK